MDQRTLFDTIGRYDRKSPTLIRDAVSFLLLGIRYSYDKERLDSLPRRAEMARHLSCLLLDF